MSDYYHVWRFNKRRNALHLEKTRRESRWDTAKSKPATWHQYQSAYRWLQANGHLFPYGALVLVCEGSRRCECKHPRIKK